MRCQGGGGGGFTVVECLVALVLLTVALLGGMTLALQRPRTLQRIEAQTRAVRALEGAMEAVRAGAVPLVSGAVPGPPGIVIVVDVEPAPLGGLWEIRLEARYLLRGQMQSTHLRSLLWRPI